jgi:hypothetical protein
MNGFEALSQEIVRSCSDLLSAHGLAVDVEVGPGGTTLVRGLAQGDGQQVRVTVQVFQAPAASAEADAALYRTQTTTSD